MQTGRKVARPTSDVTTICGVWTKAMSRKTKRLRRPPIGRNQRDLVQAYPKSLQLFGIMPYIQPFNSRATNS